MSKQSHARAYLNHIGIAVSSLPEMKKLFSILGLEISHQEAVPQQGVQTHFLKLPIQQTSLEFLEPIDPQGVISQYLKKKGPGIHHLSFEVQKGELEKILYELKSNGFQLIYETPRKGAHSMRVNFIHPKTAGGMLIEIMEKEI